MRFVNLKIEFFLDEMKKLCYAKTLHIYHTNITKLTIWFLHVDCLCLQGFSIFSPCVNNIKGNPYNLLSHRKAKISRVAYLPGDFLYI